MAREFPQAVVVEPPRLVHPDEDLIAFEHARRVEGAARDDAALAILADAEPAALPDRHRHAHDRVVGGLPVDVGQHHVGLSLGEEAAAANGRQLGGVAENQDRPVEGEQVVAEIRIDHGSTRR